MCQREFGPGTEYGLLLVNSAGHLLDALMGSIDRSAWRTRSRVTFFPWLRKLPHINWTPAYGKSCLICLIADKSSTSFTSVDGSSMSPYSTRLLQRKQQLYQDPYL